MASSSVPSTAYPASKPTALGPHERFIDQQLSQTRRQVKLVDLATCTVVLLAGLLIYFLLLVMIDHWLMPLGFWGRLAALLVLVGGAGWYLATQIWPLVYRQINPAYAAHTIEQSQPALKNNLMNFLWFRAHAGQLKEVVLRALEEQAATGLGQVSIDLAVDRAPLIRMGYLLAGVLTVCAVYTILSPKDPLTTVKRVVMPWADIQRPARVLIDDVKPGDRQVYHGQTLEVTARVRGVSANDGVYVVYSTADETTVNRRLAMAAVEGTSTFRALLPASEGGIQQNLAYQVLAGDAESPWYRVSVLPSPTITVEEVLYQFPAYTGRAEVRVKRQGDLQALEGTRVTLHAVASQPIQEAYIEFDPALGNGAAAKLAATPRWSSKVLVEGKKATVSFTLGLLADRRTPGHSSYQLRFRTPEGNENDQPIVHAIEVLPDLPPEAQILSPHELAVKVPANGKQEFEVRAIDPDFGLGALHAHVSNIAAGHEGEPLEVHSLLDPAAAKSLQITAKYEFAPEKFKLQPGDEVLVWFEAGDNRALPSGTPEPNVARTKNVRVSIVAPVDQPPKPGEKEAKPGENKGEKQPPPQGEKPQPNGNSPQAGAEGSPQPPAGEQPKSKENEQPGEKPNSQPSEEAGKKPSAGGEKSPPNAGNREPQGREPKNGGQKPAQGSPKPGEEKSEPKPSAKPNAGQGGAAGKSDAGNAGENESGAGQAGAGGKPEAGQPSGTPEKGGGEPGVGGEPAAGKSGEKPESSGDPAGENGGNLKSDGSQDADAFHEILKHRKQQEGAAEKANGGSPNAGAQGHAPAGENTPGQGETKPGAAEPKPEGGNSQHGESRPEPAKGNPGAPAAQTTGQKSQPGQGTQAQPQGAEPGPEGKPDQPSAETKPAVKPEEKPGVKQADVPDRKSGDATGAPPNAPQGKSGQPQGALEAGPEKSQPKPGGEKPQQGGQGDNGKSGGGLNGEEQGAPQSQGDNKQSRNPQRPDDRKGEEKSEAQSPGTSKKQNNAQGDQRGDQSGGGGKGGGQGGKQAGNDSAGSTSPGDEGSGAAKEQGNGETGSQAGAQQKSENKTGSAGQEKGSGSNSRPGAGQAPGEKPNPSPTPNSQGGQNGAGGEAAKAGQSGPGKQGSERTTNEPLGNWKGEMPQGPRRSSEQPPPGKTQLPPADTDTVEYARQATELALEHLRDQQDNPDPALLKKLGWTKDELRDFLDRWQSMKQAAGQQGEKGNAARDELDDALRSLGLRPGKDSLRAGAEKNDKLSGTRDSGARTTPPPEYAEQYKAFLKGTARGDKRE